MNDQPQEAAKAEDFGSDPFVAYAARTWPRERRFSKWAREAIASEILPLHLTWISTILLAVFAYFAWRESQQGTEALRGQLEAQRSDQRPWAYLAKAQPISAAVSGSSIVIRVIYSINNPGKSPAIRMRFPADVTFGEQFVLSPKFDGCDFYSNGGDDHFHMTLGDVIFPGQAMEKEIAWSINTQALGLKGFATLKSCIDYKYGADPTISHQSRFAFQINLRKDAKADNITLNNLDIIRLPLIENAAF